MRTMAMHDEAGVRTAADFAQQAASLAGTLKPGSYEAVQALAIVSIAHSLAALVERSRQP